MLEDANVRDSVHSCSQDAISDMCDKNSNNDKTEKATLKVYLSNGNFNIVKFGETTDVKVSFPSFIENLE